MKMANIRTLYDCSHARYPAEGQYITCDKEHKLGVGWVNKESANRGDRLVFKICQLCTDYDPYETPYKKEDV